MRVEKGISSKSFLSLLYAWLWKITDDFLLDKFPGSKEVIFFKRRYFGNWSSYAYWEVMGQRTWIKILYLCVVCPYIWLFIFCYNSIRKEWYMLIPTHQLWICESKFEFGCIHYGPISLLCFLWVKVWLSVPIWLVSRAKSPILFMVRILSFLGSQIKTMAHHPLIRMALTFLSSHWCSNTFRMCMFSCSTHATVKLEKLYPMSSLFRCSKPLYLPTFLEQGLRMVLYFDFNDFFHSQT